MISLKKVDLNSKELIHSFIQARAKIEQSLGIYHYSIDPFYNWLSNTGKHFYYVTEFEDDKVITFLNFTQGGYYRMIEFPYSINNNHIHEKEVFDYAMKNVAGQAYVSDYTLRYILDGKTYDAIEIADTDFYIDLMNDTWLFSNKYKHDNKVNVLEKSGNFDFREINYYDKGQIISLFDTWGKHHDLHSKLLFRNYFKEFMQINLSHCLLQYGLFYKDKLIALSIFTPTLEYYCQGIIQWSLRKGDFENCDRDLRIALSQIGQIMNYLCLNDLKFKNMRFVSIAGVNGNNTGLINHKKETCQHQISYFKVVNK